MHIALEFVTVAAKFFRFTRQFYCSDLLRIQDAVYKSTTARFSSRVGGYKGSIDRKNPLSLPYCTTKKLFAGYKIIYINCSARLAHGLPLYKIAALKHFFDQFVSFLDFFLLLWHMAADKATNIHDVSLSLNNIS